MFPYFYSLFTIRQLVSFTHIYIRVLLFKEYKPN